MEIVLFIICSFILMGMSGGEHPVFRPYRHHALQTKNFCADRIIEKEQDIALSHTEVSQ